MRNLIIGIFLGMMILSAIAFAGEAIVDFEERSVPVLNDRLEKIENDIRGHETRITALE